MRRQFMVVLSLILTIQQSSFAAPGDKAVDDTSYVNGTSINVDIELPLDVAMIPTVRTTGNPNTDTLIVHQYYNNVRTELLRLEANHKANLESYNATKGKDSGVNNDLVRSQAAIDKFRLYHNLPQVTDSQIGPDKSLFARAWNSMRNQLIGITTNRTPYELAALKLIQTLNYNLSMTQRTYNAGEHSFLLELNSFFNVVESVAPKNEATRAKIDLYFGRLIAHFYEYNRSPVDRHHQGIIKAIRDMQTDLRLMPETASVTQAVRSTFDKWLTRYMKIAAEKSIAEAEAAKLKANSTAEELLLAEEKTILEVLEKIAEPEQRNKKLHRLVGISRELRQLEIQENEASYRVANPYLFPDILAGYLADVNSVEVRLYYEWVGATLKKLEASRDAALTNLNGTASTDQKTQNRLVETQSACDRFRIEHNLPADNNSRVKSIPSDSIFARAWNAARAALNLSSAAQAPRPNLSERYSMERIRFIQDLNLTLANMGSDSRANAERIVGITHDFAGKVQTMMSASTQVNAAEINSHLEDMRVEMIIAATKFSATGLNSEYKRLLAALVNFEKAVMITVIPQKSLKMQFAQYKYVFTRILQLAKEMWATNQVLRADNAAVRAKDTAVKQKEASEMRDVKHKEELLRQANPKLAVSGMANENSLDVHNRHKDIATQLKALEEARNEAMDNYAKTNGTDAKDNARAVQTQAACDRFRMEHNLPVDPRIIPNANKSVFARAWTALRQELVGIGLQKEPRKFWDPIANYAEIRANLTQTLNANLVFNHRMHNLSDRTVDFLFALRNYENNLRRLLIENHGKGILKNSPTGVDRMVDRIRTAYNDYIHAPTNKNYLEIMSAITYIEVRFSLDANLQTAIMNRLVRYTTWLADFLKLEKPLDLDALSRAAERSAYRIGQTETNESDDSSKRPSGGGGGPSSGPGMCIDLFKSNSASAVGKDIS